LTISVEGDLVLAEQIESRPATFRNVSAAVRRSRLLSSEGIQERLFAHLFSGLVYSQIWEDPEIDLEALQLTPQDRVIAIASGGCDALSYLADAPAHITAVDLNFHHIALNRLKISAIRNLPDHRAFFKMFGEADRSDNPVLYDNHLRDKLDDETRDYWDGRDLLGRRRIEIFARNIYKKGLLGRFIGMGHAVARLYRKHPARLLEATTLREQRDLFEAELQPILRSRFVRFLVDRPLSLYGLGIPPAQYAALLTSAPAGMGMADVLERRLRRLACDFPVADNYFAWQAFGRRYSRGKAHSVPPYLAGANYERIKALAGRIDVRHANLIDVLDSAGEASYDAYVLLDAQDWMTDPVLNRLWAAIQRTAKPGARVIFRTAAEPSLLPGRVDPEILSRWTYDADRCLDWTRRDRSAIYGGFHLYRLRDAA
jgi:S-adenosylmethionine-diacylglycerol 3-amino-3-carboxypropyl transferase